MDECATYGRPRKVKVPRDPACALCGSQATITDLKTMDYRTGQALCPV